jgi:PAS domain S-box
MKIKKPLFNKVAMRITIIYMVISAVWILFSDKLLLIHPKTAIYISTVKGWFYTLVVGIIFYLLITRELNKRSKIESQIIQKNRTLHMLSKSNQALIHAIDEPEFLDKICHIIVDIGGYRMAWISFTENDKKKSFRLIARAGFYDEYLKSNKISWSTNKYGQGPSGKTVRTGKMTIINDIFNYPSTAPWKQEALNSGYKSLITLPLIANKKVFGILCVGSDEINSFDEDEIYIFNKFTEDLSFGIMTIRSLIENKNNQKALVLSEAKYRSLFETSNDGILIVDVKTGEIKEVNYRVIELLGYSPNDFLRKKIWEVNVFKNIINSKKIFEDINKQNYSRYENIPLVTKSGKTIYVEFVSNVRSVERVGVIQFSLRDVTDSYLLEEKIAQSEKRYSSLVENSNDAVILIQDGLIKYANPAVSNIINLLPQDIIGKPMIDHVAPEYRKLVAENYRKRMNGEMVETRYEFEVIDKNGNSLPVESNSSIITYEGKPADIAILRDISRAKQIDKVKSEFISVASHQLRSPLTGIKWFAQLLIKNKVGKLTVKQLDFMQQIYNSNERMIRLVNDLLNVSHIESGQNFSIDKKEGDIITLIESVIKDQKVDTLNKNIKIEINKDCPKELKLDFDYDKIYQVLSNLINNSIKYSKDNAKIIVNVDCGATEIKISVEDFGFGIPINQQNRVFQKFFRADNIITKVTDGTGLGLYIAKSIVEAHGGKMGFKSEEDAGTTFFFTLPGKFN